jgi:hypothetical protein
VSGEQSVRKEREKKKRTIHDDDDDYDDIESNASTKACNNSNRVSRDSGQ